MRLFSNILNHNRVVRKLKNLRNSVVDHIFRRRTATVGELMEQLQSLGAKPVCFCISFNTPWCIEVMIASWKRHISDTQLVIVDNSNCPHARAEIARLCTAGGIPFMALPKNPEWSLLRSHGLALNWIYHNIVVALAPNIFGFLDHDCFPTRAFRFSEQFAANRFYGVKNHSPTFSTYWNLWPGFCFFRYDSVRGRQLDFKHQVEYGLDTGGGNWQRLYKDAVPADLKEAMVDTQSFPELGIPGVFPAIEKTFLHVGGASYANLGGGASIRQKLLEALKSERCG